MVLSMDRWVGKVAIVTGASAGIGAAIAERLVEEGMKVAALARRKDKLDELAQKLTNKKGQLFPFQTDMSKEEDINKAFEFVRENLGPVHVLINNAALTASGGLLKGRTEDWDQLYRVNVLGLCTATKEAVKDMKKNNVDGHIIHINSIAGHRVFNIKGTEIYGSSKYAVTALTEALRLELVNEQSKIKVSSISPGCVETAMLRGLLDANATETFSKENAQPSLLLPQDIADGVIYVLSTPPHVQVVGIDRRKQKLEALAIKLESKKGKFHPFVADLTNEEEILQAFKYVTDNLGSVHVLVNNAAVFKAGTIVDGKTDDWMEILKVNVLALTIATREAVKDMMGNKIDGHIIHINSVVGHKEPPYPGVGLYPATKHAVTAITATNRIDLNRLKTKIKVTSISPGLVDTEMYQSNRNTVTGMEVLLEPQDVADAVLYALSTPPHVQVHELMIKPIGECF